MTHLHTSKRLLQMAFNINIIVHRIDCEKVVELKSVQVINMKNNNKCNLYFLYNCFACLKRLVLEEHCFQ